MDSIHAKRLVTIVFSYGIAFYDLLFASTPQNRKPINVSLICGTQEHTITACCVYSF